MKRLLLFLAFLPCLLFVWGQTPSNPLIQELKDKWGLLQRQISETESLLDSTRRDVGSQLDALASLTAQIAERKRYVAAIGRDLDTIAREQDRLSRQVAALQAELQRKRDNYKASLRYLYKNRTVEEKLLFILSASTLDQMYRRLRYVRQYADYQRRKGEGIMQQRDRVRAKQDELAQVKAAKQGLLKEREAEMARLQRQEQAQQQIVASLRQRQQSLQKLVARKRREADELNARIDRIVAAELEKARKRAEEEARRKAAEEARRKKAATADAPAKAATPASEAVSVAEQRLSGSFASNRGRLPMPITGTSIIVGRFGQYNVQGLRGVRLDNKGIDIQGRPGAQARAVFNGRVAAVFQLNGLFNVLVRHGAYISVYCNLSSVWVKADEEVCTRQPLGEVFSDTANGGRTVLHFQLRRERDKLNPEPWLAR